MGLKCLSGQDLSSLKFSNKSDNLLFDCCPQISNFKEILQFLVTSIILNIIIDNDKL